MPANLDRAILLLNQSRYEMAEQELRGSLADDPANPIAHAFLALCLAARGQWQEAGREAGAAVGLAPDFPFAHYVAAKVLLHEDRYDDAETAVGEAIRLDPSDVDSYALLAAIHFERRRWAKTLETAEQGLAIDADHADCVNLRAMALVQLGRQREAGEAIAGALARDPENALSHANQGWTLLHQGDHRKALDHFREALRIDPDLEWARAGIVEALKARYLIYRLMLRFFLWMARLSDQGRWVVIAAIFFGPNLLRSLGKSNPTLAPVLGALATSVVGFALMTWIADPLFNLLLRLNRFGRLALSRDQVVASNWLGLCVLVAIGSAVALAATGASLYFQSLIVSALMMIPIAATFRAPAGRPRAVMATLAVALALVGLATIAPIFIRVAAVGASAGLWAQKADWVGIYRQLLNVFWLGVLGSTWAGAAIGRRG